MYARIATFQGGDNERLRQMAEDRRNSGQMQQPDGLKRIMVLHDGESNRRLFISFFDTRDQVAAAEQTFEQMGDEVPEEIRGRRTSVDVYEVVWEGEP